MPTGTVDLVVMTVEGAICGASLGDGLEHIAEIGVAVAATDRRADGEEDDIGALHAFAQRAREMHAAGCDIARHQIVEPRLVDGYLALFQPGDTVLVLVDAGDVPTEVGKTGGGNQADVTRANHANFHGDPLTLTGRKLDLLSTVYGQKPQPRSSGGRGAGAAIDRTLAQGLCAASETARKLDLHDRDRHRHIGFSGAGCPDAVGAHWHN